MREHNFKPIDDNTDEYGSPLQTTADFVAEPPVEHPVTRGEALPDVPPEPPKPKALSRQDLIELENLDLKMKNVHLQMQMMQRDLALALTQKDELVKLQVAKREEILKNYGVDIGTVRIGPDGTFLTNT